MIWLWVTGVILWFIRWNIHSFGLHSCFWFKTPKTLDISWRFLLYDVNEVTLGKPLRLGAGCQGNQKLNFQSHSPTSWKEREAGGWIQAAVANDLINNAYVTLHKNSKGPGSFWIGEHRELPGERRT